jgi:hypothetical protein
MLLREEFGSKFSTVATCLIWPFVPIIMVVGIMLDIVIHFFEEDE